MGEFLRGNPESSEDEQRYDQEPLELAVNSLSRVVGDQDDVNSKSVVFEEEDDYDDDCGEEDDVDYDKELNIKLHHPISAISPEKIENLGLELKETGTIIPTILRENELPDNY